MPSAPSPPRGAALTWVPRAAVEGPRCGEAGRAAGGRAAPLLLEGAALRRRVPGAAGEEGRKEGGPPSGRGSRRDGTRGAPEPRAAPSLSSGGRSSQQHPADINTPLPKRRISPRGCRDATGVSPAAQHPPLAQKHLAGLSAAAGGTESSPEPPPRRTAPCRAVGWGSPAQHAVCHAAQHSQEQSAGCSQHGHKPSWWEPGQLRPPDHQRLLLQRLQRQR